MKLLYTKHLADEYDGMSGASPLQTCRKWVRYTRDGSMMTTLGNVTEKSTDRSITGAPREFPVPTGVGTGICKYLAD